ncbi:MAG TPA: dipeptidase [Hanamia sp.]|nr:dipeptidase [Hanamia sp.]
MKVFVLFSFVAIIATSANSQPYKKIHADAIVCDTHNDIISTCIERGYSLDQDLSGKTHSDLNRILRGGLDVQVFSIFCDGKQKNPYQFANREIDTLYAWVKRNPSKMVIVTNPKELKKAVSEHKLASMMGVEGGHMIEEDLKKIDSLYERGVRYMTLTWNNNNSWATSAEYESGNQKINGKTDTTSQKKGLSDFGRQVVKRMNELGMMVDLSHVGDQTFWDAISISTKPILVSHSDCYALCPAFRNLKDDMIKAVGKNGGVIDLNFYPAFLDSTVAAKQKVYFQKHRAEIKELIASGKKDFEADDIIAKRYPEEIEAMQAPFSLLFDHMEHIIKLAGIDHVGLGGDFDGISITPKVLTDVTKYPEITKELVRRGYSKTDIDKIMGGNFIRVFEANQRGKS